MHPKSLFADLTRALSPALAVTALLTFSLVAPAMATPGGTPTRPDHNPPFTAIYVLGDSLSDTGRTSSVLSQPGVPFPPPPYAAGRLTNGPVWIEHLSPRLRRAYNPLDNFSWAGATTGNLNVYGLGLPGMQDQLNELLASSGVMLDRNALYVVFGGTNDFSQLFASPPANPAEFIPAGVANIVQIVATLSAAGAEHIVVVDLPDLGHAPRALSAGPAASAFVTQLSTTFNSLLNAALDELPFPIVRVSAFDLVNDFVARPRKYGFTNVTSPGLFDLANADTYLFWDDLHPTTRAHQYLADAIFHALAREGMLRHKK